MTLVKIPEHILYNHIKYGLSYLKSDLKSSITNGDETKSIIYRLFGDTGIEKYNFFTEAKSILLREKTVQNYLRTEIGYNMQKVQPPCIYIVIPSEDMTQGVIGFGQEGNDYTMFDETLKTYETLFSQNFQSTYQIMIISENSNEVVLLYNLLKTIFISLNSNISLAGLKNLKIGGGDVTIKTDLVPKNMFIRAFRVSFSYTTTSIEFDTHEYATDIVFSGTAIDPDYYYGGGLGLNNI